jgi:hypothetical protein
MIPLRMTRRGVSPLQLLIIAGLIGLLALVTFPDHAAISLDATALVDASGPAQPEVSDAAKDDSVRTSLLHPRASTARS